MPISLDIHGLGGLCSWRGSVTPLGAAAIAWGGVAGQLVLYVLAMVAIAVFGSPSTPTMMDLRVAFIEQNVFLIVLNLMPIPPLDGSTAWRLPVLLLVRLQARLQARKRENARRDTVKKLRRLDRANAHIRLVQSDVDEILRKAITNSRDKSDSQRK